MDGQDDTVIDGKLFNELYEKTRPFYILTDEENKINFKTVKEGFNAYNYNSDDIDYLCYSGYEFSNVNNLFYLIKLNIHAKFYRQIEIPDDATVGIDNNIFYSDKIVAQKSENISDLSVFQFENQCLAIVENYPKFVKFMKSASEIVYKTALLKNSNVLEFIDENDQTEELCMIAVKDNSDLLQFAKKQNLLMCQIAVHDNCYNINFINESVLNKIDIMDLWKIAIREDGYLLKYKNDPDDELIDFALKVNPNNIKHVKNPSEEQCLKVIKRDPLCLKYLNKITKKISITAVSLNGLAFKYTEKEKDLDYDIFFAAIHNNCKAMNYLEKEEQDDELCITACIINPKCLNYILDLDRREKCKMLIENIIYKKIDK